jgi:hypothetical protein
MTEHKTMSHFATEADYWKFKYEELRAESRDDRTMAVRQIVNLEMSVEDLQEELQRARKSVEVHILDFEKVEELIQKMKCCGNCKHAIQGITCIYGNTCTQYIHWSLKE